MHTESNWYPQINTQACTGCGDCIAACPTGALGQVGGRAALVQPQVCTYCAACEEVCPEYAIDLPYLICFSHDCNDTNNEREQ